MEDIFKPTSLTIQQLFGNADALYQIPRYQRPYSWGDDQLDKLWDDLLQAEENDPNYFLGSIITAKPEDNLNYLDIVDGQQRLTTLIILLCVYRDLYPNINEDVLESDPFAVDSKIIQSSIKFNDRFERLRLRTHASHQSDFERIILNGNTTIHKKPYKKDLKKEEEPSLKFKNSAHFFTEKLGGLGAAHAGRLLNYLFNKVKVIRIDCQSVSFAIKLFQVLNDRGLELSNSDLIKSFLIGKIQKKYESNDETKKQKEDQFMSDWVACEAIANGTGTPLNDLFVTYEYYLLESNPKKSLYDELIVQFSTKDSNEIIADFKKFITSYKLELVDKEDTLIYSFRYLRWSVYWRTILCTAIHCNYPDFRRIAKLLRRYYYVSWIAGFTLSRIKQTSFNFIKWLKEGKPIAEIETELEANLVQNNAFARATDNLQDDIYHEQWCKPLLCMIEYNQTDASNLNFLSIADRNLHVEHICPVAHAKNLAWSHLTATPHIDTLLNSGGNLTLLSGEKNISASNEEFKKKIIAYSGKGHYANDKDGITAFRITQKIVDDFNSSRYQQVWNIQSINDRWEWFCTHVEAILSIDLSSIKKAP